MSRPFTRCREGSIASISLSRPDLHNAFNEVVIAELTAAFEKAGKDESVRVVVLAGEGKSFCAGADVNWMRKMVDYTVEENVADAMAMARMLRMIRECPKPVIARIHGAAIGGGVGLVAACDIAVAVESAVFSLSEVKLGIIPAVISPFVLEKIGPGQFRRYALTAERFGAQEAKRIGLVHEVVGSEAELDQRIGEIAETLKANGPKALAACKRVMTDVTGVMWDKVQDLTARRIAELRVSDEGQEGLKAFLEKRKPKWQG
jgi:methylglutaconyl-CoA hydratase